MLRIPAVAAIAKVLLTAIAMAAGPNVLLVTPADLGRWDLSPAAGEGAAKTPALDAFRAGSVVLDRCYGSPTPAAGRTALLAGVHEFRAGVTHELGGRNFPHAELPLLPGMFRAAGYRTALTGTWLLGDSQPFRPEDRGFEDICVVGGGGIGSTGDLWGNAPQDPVVRRRGGWERTSGAASAVFFGEAERWMAARVAAKERFFLMVAPESLAAAEAKDFRTRIETFDTRFGELMAALEKSGAAERTIVVVVSSNGSPFTGSGRRGTRGTPDEGGVRVPCLIRWPGTLPAGKVVTELTALPDLLPTLATLCEVPTGEGWKGDGADLAAALHGRGEFPTSRLLMTQAGGWPGSGAVSRNKSRDFAVRDDRWCLTGVELFDLVADPAQERSVFSEHPAELQRLLTAYGRWWTEVLPAMEKPAGLPVGTTGGGRVRLTARDWWPSLVAEDALGAEAVADQASLRAVLTRVLAGQPQPSVSGHWKLDVAREGNYEAVFSLLPPEAHADERRALGRLRAGEAKVRAGKDVVTLKLQEGATSVNVPVDLAAGPVEIEMWFEGQLPDGILGAFHASLERKGPRKLAVPDVVPAGGK